MGGWDGEGTERRKWERDREGGAMLRGRGREMATRKGEGEGKAEEGKRTRMEDGPGGDGGPGRGGTRGRQQHRYENTGGKALRVFHVPE